MTECHVPCGVHWPGTYLHTCQDSDGSIITCVLRFVKIKSFKGVNYLTNSFDASQVHVNPLFNEVDVFRQVLPDDGLSLICRQRQPRWGMVAVQADNAEDFPRRTIEELKNSVEIGKARIHVTVYAIDTDWAWYYISCRSCNKKVEKVNDGDNGLNNKRSKPRFWCYNCNTVVTNVVSRFMLYANVMDSTGETKLLLFDSICSEIIGQSAPSVLGGSVDEIIDPENLPDPVKSLIGKTYLFLVNVEKAHIFDGKDNYKVSKVLLKDGLLDEQLLENSSDTLNATPTVTGDQGPLMLECSPQVTDSTTPSSKRIYPANSGTSNQNSTSKKLCIEPVDLEKSNPEFRAERVHEKTQGSNNKDGVGKQMGVYDGSVVTKSMDEGKEKPVGVKIKVEKKE